MVSDTSEVYYRQVRNRFENHVHLLDLEGEKKVIVTRSRVVPYELVLEKLQSEGWAAVLGVNRKTAHSAAEILSKKLNRKVYQHAIFAAPEKDVKRGRFEAVKGYLFSFERDIKEPE